MNNSINGCEDLSFALRLACFRWHDDGASVGVMIVGERAVTTLTVNPLGSRELTCSVK